jgi:hypothetical protein
MVTLVPPRDVGKSPFQITVEPANLAPKIDTHSPGWMVGTVLLTGTIPPDVIDGADAPAGEEKFAVTLSAALIVTVVAALAASPTAPVQPVNAYPALAVAAIGTTVPAS